MRNLRDDISRLLLPRVRQPSQYVGLEVNACCGDVSAADVTVVMAFPDMYSIGISHLGSQLLYHALNRMEGVACDRTYCPAPDAEEVMRASGLSLFGWESRCAIGDFDIVGFSLSYEMCATNVLTMLDLAGIPIRAEGRSEEHPIVVGGDAMADTPEPMAPFIDIFIAGDGEEPLMQLVKLVGGMKGGSREAILLAAAQQVPGAYVPRFYGPRYDEAGGFAELAPLRDDVPRAIQRVHLPKLTESPVIEAPLVPLTEGIHERVMVEVMRGCPNSCRFCQAGCVRLPVRSRPVEEIVAGVRKALAATGYREVSLLSLSTSDYPHLDELIDRLSAELTPQHVSISLPSLRVDSQLRHLPGLTSTVRKAGLTIAAEAGSQRLRSVINKQITEEDMITGVRAAYQAGWSRVKVYFMAGLPGETEEDIDSIFDLCMRLARARREVDGHVGSISASVSWAVPKPHTPMQWLGMREADYFWAVRGRLREMAQRSPVNFKFHYIERSLLEAVLCRGDRRVADVIEATWRNGARLDSWDEHFDYNNWLAGFKQTGIDAAFYAHRPLATDAALPWSHIKCYRSEEFLLREFYEMVRVAGG